MKHISNADYAQILRLLQALSATKGLTIREKENARKASILHKKLIKRDARSHHTKVNPE